MSRIVLLAPFVFAASACSAQTAPGLATEPTEVFPKSWGLTYSGAVESSILGETRRVRLYLPSSFPQTTRRYPVLYFFDGEYYFERAALAVRQLEAAGHIPDCIVVALETPERRQDLTPPGMDPSTSDGLEAKGEKLLQFIDRELRPELEAKFRAGGPAALIGHSHGGILCLYAAAKWRKQFPFIVSLDGPTHLDDGRLPEALIKSAPSDDNLRLVSLDVRFGWTDEDWKRLESSAPKHWQLKRIRMKGEDHESMVFAGFFEGLKELFADYSLSQVRGLPGEKALHHYVNLKPLYGAEVMPPRAVLDRALRTLTALGKGDKARTALRLISEGYGEPVNASELRQEIEEAEAAMKGRPTVDQLLAMPAPTPDQVRPYLGTWEGESRIDIEGSERRRLVVTISIKEGKGVASFFQPDAPEEFQRGTYEYFQVTREGVEFGNVNGMFPPGIVTQVGRVREGRMEGEMIFRGVHFKYPADMKPPRHLFWLIRKAA